MKAKIKVEQRGLAEQAAEIIGVPSETVRVIYNPLEKSVVVELGKLTPKGFIVSGDVPTDKRDLIAAWAQKL